MRYEDPPTQAIEAGQAGRSAAGLPEPPQIAPGRRLGDRYLLERRLGHGGMAVVWLATDERLGRPVAVKVLSDTLTAERDYRGRFEREARVAAGLQHPNLVAVYDYDAGQRPYLVMEYIEGGDLAAHLERGEPLAVERLAGELLSALAHIHAAGILHRDIKPQNVLVDHHGAARLSDFGIARPRDATSLTRTGEVIGTERYLAPEVRAGDPATERSDLYALGVVLADAARGGAQAALLELADELRERDPARRPTSAAAAHAEFERRAAGSLPGEPTERYIVGPEPPPAAGPPPAAPRFEPSPTGVRGRRRGRAIAAGAIAAAAAAALGVAVIGGGDGGDGPRTPADVDRGARTDGGSAAASAQAEGGGSDTPTPAEAPVDEAVSAPADEGTESVAATSDGDGAALNDEGFALVGAGRYEEAVSVLEGAVAELRGSGDEATYNYALYNLASAYLGAGRPADAIPLLKERMAFDDGQLDEVAAALDRARAEAGVGSPSADSDE